jgi:hypothetical protein
LKQAGIKRKQVWRPRDRPDAPDHSAPTYMVAWRHIGLQQQRQHHDAQGSTWPPRLRRQGSRCLNG